MAYEPIRYRGGSRRKLPAPKRDVPDGGLPLIGDRPILGVRHLGSALAAMPRGIDMLARAILPGEREGEAPRNEVLSDFGTGILQSLLSTGSTLLPGSHYLANKSLPEDLQAKPLWERAWGKDGQGLLLPLLEDVGNVAAAGRLMGSEKLSRPFRTGMQMGRKAATERGLFPNAMARMDTHAFVKPKLAEMRGGRRGDVQALRPLSNEISWHIMDKSGLDMDTAAALLGEEVNFRQTFGKVLPEAEGLDWVKPATKKVDPRQRELALRAMREMEPQVQQLADLGAEIVRKELALLPQDRGIEGLGGPAEITMKKGQQARLSKAAVETDVLLKKRWERDVAREMRTPSPAQVPPEYRRMAVAWQELRKQKALPRDADFQELMNQATEQGWSPIYMGNQSPNEVLAWSKGQLRLGQPEGIKEAISPLRRRRIDPEEIKLSSQALEAPVGAAAAARWERISNELLPWLDTISVEADISKMGKFVPYAPNHKGLLSIITGEHERVLTPGVTKMIPKAAADVLHGYHKDWNNMFTKYMGKVTDPWRFAVLTASPRWYVYNAIGNTILATAEGVKIKDWLKAWHQMKIEGGAKGALWGPEWERRFPNGIPPEITRLGLARDVMEESLGSIVTHRNVRSAMAAQTTRGGKIKTGLVETGNRFQRANEIIDELARLAVYEQKLRKGLTASELKELSGAGLTIKEMTEKKALERAVNALVNYGDLSPLERSLVRSVIPFYAWQKGMLKVAGRLAIDHPARVRFTMALGGVNSDLLREEQELLPYVYKGLLPFGDSHYLMTRGGNPFADSVTLTTPQGMREAMNPFLEIVGMAAFGKGVTPFSPQEEGPLGFAEPKPQIAQELFNVARNIPAGFLMRRMIEDAEPRSASVGRFFGIPIMDEARRRELIERKKRTGEQVEKGLPLPPARRTSGPKRTRRSNLFPER